MARLSSPESVLKKLDQAYQKIDELYETVDLIHKVKDKFNTSYEDIRTDETCIKKTISEFNELESVYEKTINRLEEIGRRSEKEVGNLIFEFHQKEAKISEALVSLHNEREIIKRNYRILYDKISIMNQEIALKSEDFTTQLKTLIKKSQDKIFGTVEESKKHVQEEVTRLSEFKARSQEEIHHLKSGLKTFEARLNDEFNQKMKAVSQQQTMFEERANQDISLKFSNEMQKINAESAHEKVRVNDAVQLLLTEKEVLEAICRELDNGFLQLNEDMATKAARFEGQLIRIQEESQERIAQTIEESQGILQIKADEFSDFMEKSQKETEGLKEELESFRNTVKEELTFSFSEERRQFQEAAKIGIQNIYSELSQEKSAIHEKLQLLEIEIKDMDKMRGELNDELSRINQHITAKTTYLTGQLKKMMVNLRHKIIMADNESKRIIDEKSNQLASFTEKSKREFYALRNDLEIFKTETNEYLNNKISEIFDRQETFQHALTEKLFSEISEEAKHIQAITEANIMKQQELFQHALTEKLFSKLSKELENIQVSTEDNVMTKADEFFKQQHLDIESLPQKIEGIEQQISDIQTAQRTSLQERRLVDSKFTEFIKKLIRTQNDHRNRLPDMESRIKIMEEMLEELHHDFSLEYPVPRKSHG